MKTLIEKESEIKEQTTNHDYSLVLHNDDVNTFDWVIECLIKICHHSIEQATQCAYITHFHGKCVVKTGDSKTLTKMKNLLTQNGLTVTIEKNNT